MQKQEIDQILSEWSKEFNESLGKSNALCVALFGADRKLLFATPAMDTLFKGEPYKSFINPTFDQLLEIKSEGSLIFEGLLTIGNYSSINSSIVAHVFFKEGKMLVVGGADSAQLIDQYTEMHHLNHQINNLQRKLLKEKSTLENTLNQLNETNSILQQINATKNKFFSIIAHDLNSPFNSIIGFSEILVEQVKENNLDGIEKYSGFILQSSNKAMALLMNLMKWAQSQTGRMEFNPEYFEMEAFINEATLLSDDISRQKSINIKKVLSQNASVFADKAMINTVFRNLISNAIKFTMPGGEITISAEVKQREILFFVSDTGIGIPKNSIEKIFRIEQSYSTPGTNKEKGTGLGLILCKEFVEKHGGKIWVESEEGKGSIFYFTIPYNVEPKQKNNIKNDISADTETYVEKLKILIVEDNHVSEMLIAINVNEFGKEILKAETGVEAVEACRNNPDIDLVLMDIQMSEMGGYEATRQIREFNKEVIIIAQTAYGLSGDKEKAKRAGCNDYISKPIKKEELYKLINKYF